jgi:predicted deacylase
MSPAPFWIGGEEVQVGSRRTIELPVSVLSNHTPMSLAIHAIHGSKPGPVLFLSGAVHGDEILGVEIIRRVVRHQALNSLSGTLLAVPIVNAFGFLSHSRYMPDRRDLNRSFPGSDHGSLASLLADLFLREVVLRSSHGIDLHTAGLHRTNLPQIRIAPDEPELLELAQAFGPPVVLISRLREGTLRHSARDHGVKMLLYEGGEALRFDEAAIRTAVSGVLRVMRALGMIAAAESQRQPSPPVISHASAWLRAPEGGMLRAGRMIGERVSKGDKIAEISDPLGLKTVPLISNETGIVIGRTNLPIVHRGEALFHIARIKDADRLGPIGSELAAPPPYDEDEII